MKSATEIVQEVLFSTVLDSIAGLKQASKGMPNQLVRDISTIHPNTTFADLPKEVQDAIAANVRLAFARLLKEGYSVSQAGLPERPQRAAVPPQGGRPPRRDGPRPPRPPRPTDGGGKRPPRKPGPPRG